MQRSLVQKLGFTPKENASGIYQKKYSVCNDYLIEIDFKKNTFYFGGKIKIGEKEIQNITKPEDWVVLECVDRLLEKGYQPQKITLEKTWKTGHGTSGRLDILVACRDSRDTYLMIECKIWETEFDKEFKNLEENGGQLFTYFQQDKNAEVLMLYTSKLEGEEIIYRNEIVKIEEHYREAGNKEDVFDRWNKVTNTNGIFNNSVTPYLFESKSLTKQDLRSLNEEDSKKIFNQFVSILRKHSISDKPNAFNKIFNLFLAKICDEKKRDTAELEFQWKEHNDNAVDFQIRLINLYKSGMWDFLLKEVKGIDDDMFNYKTQEELKERKKHILLFNKVYDIKDVFDEESFEDNQKVLKEVVQLLQKYQIRYPRRQQHLSDFFERLLTTGLKQEAGQFFTPIPITRFIVRSLPISKYVKNQLNSQSPKLPAVIDYAAGSGHFLTEIMEEYQRIIDKDIDPRKLKTGDAERKIKSWQVDKYDWASKYIWGIEKDYRLVKVAKVGCYFYGDGLAQVIHGDGLDNFKKSKNYRGLLQDNDNKPQFSFVVSNPPYSVKSFKGDFKNTSAKTAFDLYDRLTDQSSEIECLFVERTKQLLEEGGIAGVILPSSILSNTGIYTQTREIILKYFDVVAITEMGSNTFMATGTNTVILFLKRRNNADWGNIQSSVSKIYTNTKDDTINGIENPITKYVTHVWKESVTYEDYKTLLQKKPNEAIIQHEIYQEYQKKFKDKNDKEKFNLILALEQEKLLYFIIALPQKIVLVKTGSKKEEKNFLGYEFSNRRGSEGIHSTQGGETIDDCTQLYDANAFDNPEKASTYIYKAFSENCFNLDISKNLQNNISYQNLVDMITFDRVDFEKMISLSVKKKVKIESKWELKNFSDFVEIEYGKRIVKQKEQGSIYPVYGGGGETFKSNDFNRENRFIISRFGMSPKSMRFVSGKFFLNDSGFTVKPKNNSLTDSYLQYFLFKNQLMIYYCGRGVAQKNIDFEQFNALKIPLPPKDIQEKIVAEIEVLEKEEQEVAEEVEKLKEVIFKLLSTNSKQGVISDICELSKEKISPKDTPNKEFNYLGLEHMESNTGKITSKNKEIGNNIQSVKNVFKKGNVLYGKLRPYLNKVVLIDFEGICSTDILVLKSQTPLLLKYILLAENVVEQTSKLMRGVSLPRIKINDFLSVKVPVIFEKEQQKIVEEIEKIEAKINTLEKEIELIPDKKELILKKYLE